jgi:hypothetical protein
LRSYQHIIHAVVGTVENLEPERQNQRNNVWRC